MKRPAIFLSLFLLLSSGAFALSVNGYYENDLVIINKPSGGANPGDLNKLRLKLDLNISESLAAHIEPRYYFFIRDDNLPVAGATGLDELALDSAYIKYYGAANVTLGKQRIAWGTGYIWNPTDIFNPFVLSFAVNNDEEVNVKAARIEVPLGMTGILDGYVVPEEDRGFSRKGIRAKTNIGLFDVSASIAAPEPDRTLYGVDFAGDVLGFGVIGEAALNTRTSSSGYVQAVIGGDYTLDNGINIQAQYYYNEPGKTSKADYDWAALYAGNISQLAKSYIFVGFSKIIDELAAVKLSTIINLDDQSFMLYPAYTRSIAQYVDLSLEAMITGGTEGSEFKPGTIDPTGFGGSNMLLCRVIYNF